MTRRTFLLPLALGCAPIFLGCNNREASSPPIPKTAPVRGQVLYKGQPIADVRVTLHPQPGTPETEWVVSGMTDKEGKFVIGTGDGGNGAPPGEYRVTFKLVTTEQDPNSPGLEAERDGWRGKHLTPSAGPRVSVKDGENVLETFKLD